MTLGSLWKAPDNQHSLLPLQRVTTATLEIAPLIPTDLKAEVDDLAANPPTNPTPQALAHHKQLLEQAITRTTAAAEHAIRDHLTQQNRGLLNTNITYTTQTTDTTFEVTVILTQAITRALARGIALTTTPGHPHINICP
ncbi:hypothetical protein, partial [Streptomyces kaempferi]